MRCRQKPSRSGCWATSVSSSSATSRCRPGAGPGQLAPPCTCEAELVEPMGVRRGKGARRPARPGPGRAHSASAAARSVLARGRDASGPCGPPTARDEALRHHHVHLPVACGELIARSTGADRAGRELAAQPGDVRLQRLEGGAAISPQRASISSSAPHTAVWSRRYARTARRRGAAIGSGEPSSAST